MSVEKALRLALVPPNPWEFKPPPEAPLFEPSAEEFADPLGYVAKIRPLAEPYGICKIRPPPDWQPPFALDVDNLRFVPRVQRLTDLEAMARTRAHFEDLLYRFWELKGEPFSAPVSIDDSKLDLYALHRAVDFHGGFDHCDSRGLWPRVVSFLSFAPKDETIVAIRDVYFRRLLPFRRTTEKNLPPKKEDPEPGPSDDNKPTVKDEKPPPINPTPSRPARFRKQDLSREKNRELRRLAWYGAGPRDSTDDETPKPRKRPKFEADPLAPKDCVICLKNSNDCVVCGECGDSYHSQCIESPGERPSPSLLEWRCPPCVVRLVKKPPDAYGFAQAECEYTLQEFGAKADKFKSEYFGAAPHLVPPAVVEKEFWRVVATADEDVSVEYGADLHSMDHGSGFPTRSCRNLHPGDQMYLESGWNLNNLPVLDGSVLQFMNDEISGMTVPWMYVGMCFSAFCWHNEDHWSYSINFLHWGDSKTWYGVPGSGAEKLEATMREVAPELFGSQPDLLHQLVTTLNPNVLSEAGVPVYRIDQNAGEFVITFPRSYHAGFNQGYNFAEAVNFAPPDWLPIGRECVSHYKSLKRFCVFSHDELVCKIGLVAEVLDLSVAIPAYKELVDAARAETERRGELAERGVRLAARRQFELYDDDRRLCDTCKTTCFLSALTCNKCSAMVCLDHSAELCSCPPDTLLLYYRYKLDELHDMIAALKRRIQSFDEWMTDAKKALNPEASRLSKETAASLLVERAAKLKIAKCVLLDRLIATAEKKMTIDSEVIEIPD